MNAEHPTVTHALETGTEVEVLVQALQRVRDTLTEIVEADEMKDTYLADVLRDLIGIDEPEPPDTSHRTSGADTLEEEDA